MSIWVIIAVVFTFGSFLYVLSIVLNDAPSIHSLVRYLGGCPIFDEVQNKEGIFEIKGNTLIFRDLFDDNRTFIILDLKEIIKARFSRNLMGDLAFIMTGFWGLTAERCYLDLTVKKEAKEYKLFFSGHRKNR